MYSILVTKHHGTRQWSSHDGCYRMNVPKNQVVLILIVTCQQLPVAKVMDCGDIITICV